MTDPDQRTERAVERRQRAMAIELEQDKLARARVSIEVLSPEAIRQMVRELHVHQIELEMQNEELRRVQTELEDSRAGYFELYDLAPVGYCTVSSTGLILQANLCAASLLGVVRGSLVKQPIVRFIFTEDRGRYYLLRKRLVETGEPQRADLRLRKGDGTSFWVQLAATVVKGGAPELRIVLNDISKHKQVMAELQSSEDRLQLAKMAAGLGLYDHDIIRGKVELDERAREFFGFGPDEPFSYAAFMAGVHPDDRAATQVAIEQAYDATGTGNLYAEGVVINRTDNSARHLVASGRVIFENGRATRSVGVLRDNSAQKRLAKELQGRRREMESLVNQQVAVQTAAAIAHELNQPLVAVSAFSEAALSMLRGGTRNPEKLRRALEGAMEQAQRAGRTLHELLGFLHKSEATAEPLDLDGAVKDALALADESGYGEFRATIELDQNLPAVLANRLQLQKVLMNLFHNGVDAVRSTGASAAAIIIKVRTLNEKRMAQVTVQDNGPGLDAATAHRIFDPFFTTKPDGIGLGLAISRSLIEANGGQLWADVDAGGGASFHFTVPFAK